MILLFLLCLSSGIASMWQAQLDFAVVSDTLSYLAGGLELAQKWEMPTTEAIESPPLALDIGGASTENEAAQGQRARKQWNFMFLAAPKQLLWHVGYCTNTMPSPGVTPHTYTTRPTDSCRRMAQQVKVLHVQAW